MGHEIHHILKSKRLIWVVAITFGIVIMLHYFEFPFGDVASSLFASSSQIPKSLSNITSSDVSNDTTPFVGLGDTGDRMEQKHNSTFEKVDENEHLAANNATFQPFNNTSKPHTDDSLVKVFPPAKKSHKKPIKVKDIVTISQMRNILLHNRATVSSMVSKVFHINCSYDYKLLNGNVSFLLLN